MKGSKKISTPPPPTLYLGTNYMAPGPCFQRYEFIIVDLLIIVGLFITVGLFIIVGIFIILGIIIIVGTQCLPLFCCRKSWRRLFFSCYMFVLYPISTVMTIRDAPFDFWGGGPRLLLSVMFFFSEKSAHNFFF